MWVFYGIIKNNFIFFVLFHFFKPFTPSHDYELFPFGLTSHLNFKKSNYFRRRGGGGVRLLYQKKFASSWQTRQRDGHAEKEANLIFDRCNIAESCPVQSLSAWDWARIGPWIVGDWGGGGRRLSPGVVSAVYECSLGRIMLGYSAAEIGWRKLFRTLNT